MALAAAILCVAGCGGGNNPPPGPDVAQMQQVAADADRIITQNIDYDDLAQSIQDTVDVLAEQIGGQVSSFEWGPDHITILHPNFARETWFFNPQFTGPDVTDVQIAPATAKAIVGNQNAIVMDTLANVPVFAAQHTEVLAAIRAQLDALGFTVQQIDGVSADIEAFKNFDDAGVVFLLTHGLAVLDDYFLETGEPVTLVNRATYMQDWEDDIIRPSHALYEGDPGVAGARWLVSDAFFNREYSAGNFPGTLFYNAASQGTTNSALSSILEAKGVACYIGWSQSQDISPWHAQALFGLMSDGSTVSAAMPRVPEALRQWLTPPAVPQLGAGSDGSCTLVEANASAVTP